MHRNFPNRPAFVTFRIWAIRLTQLIAQGDLDRVCIVLDQLGKAIYRGVVWRRGKETKSRKVCPNGSSFWFVLTKEDVRVRLPEAKGRNAGTIGKSRPENLLPVQDHVPKVRPRNTFIRISVPAVMRPKFDRDLYNIVTG